MMDHQLRAQRIYRAIASLSLNTTSQPLQDALKNLFISNLTTSGQRAVDIGKSEILPAVERGSDLGTENILEIGNTSLSQKVSDLKQPYPELKKQAAPSSEMTDPLKMNALRILIT